VRLGHRKALFSAVLATTFSVSALAGGSSLPAHEEAQDGGKRQHEAVGPSHAFPMRAVPEYGDGLDAGRGHEGQDMFAPAGTPLIAVSRAVVLETGSDGGRGNYVSIYDSAAKRTYNYFHMLAPALVDQGDRVRSGEKLGELGCTGSCWGYHLHFEVRAGRSPYGPVLDPMPTLRRLADQPPSLLDRMRGFRAG
jgi:murein DD-endopeptidase MepM/ murein hydrolase activator NlpD